MADRAATPTRAPLYLGSIRADAVCDRHGEMVGRGPPVFGRDGRVYAACEGVSLFACPECCLDLVADAGEPNADHDRVVELLWRQYLENGWDELPRDLLVDLGLGWLGSRSESLVVLSADGDLDETGIPEYLRGRVVRVVR